MSGYITEEDINEEYLEGLVNEIAALVKSLNPNLSPETDTILELATESTILKSLVYMNRLDLPKPLKLTVAEMIARQLPDYLNSLKNDKPQGVVKKIQRGGFMEEYETKGTEANTPRGTLFMSDYVKYLNKYRRLRII